MSNERTFTVDQQTLRAEMASVWSMVSNAVRAGAVEVVLRRPKNLRSLSQNRKLWPMLTDISKQIEWPVDGAMQLLEPEDWKDILSAGVRKEQRVAQGIGGGESMMPEYSRSHLIFVDPDRPLENGNDIVVYVAEKNEAILRRYIEEPGSGKMLKALNPAFGTQYEQLRDEDRVIGVVVADMRLR